MEAGNASDESEGTIDESEIEEESVEVTEKTRKRKFKIPKLSKPNVPKGNGSLSKIFKCFMKFEVLMKP